MVQKNRLTHERASRLGHGKGVRSEVCARTARGPAISVCGSGTIQISQKDTGTKRHHAHK